MAEQLMHKNSSTQSLWVKYRLMVFTCPCPPSPAAFPPGVLFKSTMAKSGFYLGLYHTRRHPYKARKALYDHTMPPAEKFHIRLQNFPAAGFVERGIALLPKLYYNKKE